MNPSRAERKRQVGLGLLPWLGLALAGVASLLLGSVALPFGNLGQILLDTAGERSVWGYIFYMVRMPKALTALLAGAALAAAGLQMQTLFLNPLAGPFVLGINAGASLGVAAVLLAGGPAAAVLGGSLAFAGGVGATGAAVAGAGLVLALVLLMAHRVSVTTLIVLGLMLSYVVSAVVSLLLYFSHPERIQAFLAWSFGSFGGVTWQDLRLLAPAVVLGLVLAGLAVKPLNALLLGEDHALSLGIDVRRMRWLVLLSASLLAGAVTAFAGPVAFIGVAVPHLARSLLRTADHRVLLPACLSLGGLVALLADLAAQLPGTQTVLPLNAVTAVFGAPVVIWALLRRPDAQAAFTS